ncbi:MULTISPECIES: metal ABC transporter solute-binding protein, Zn/Mn family [Clostridium]|uniref:metal ABC transporter solute-binding protein, Zn/Mn family n=1 Tax=Clostridium TaxID=1485 RepID=UPI000824463C|nr:MULTISPECIES: zinc ABC transporter substrate-binding protein [Clostridium]PJI06759.1 ABC transporter substrate-binding protein [Clostridium sp. CT7]
MLKKFFSLIIILITTMSFVSCTNTKNFNDKKIKVAVSFNAMRELTYAIGKNKVDIVTIIPNGTEPHDFDPNAKDIKTLYDCKVFVYSGLGMETWVDKALKLLDYKSMITVKASTGINPIKNADASEVQEHGKYDPHSWMSLKDAKIESKNIRNALIKADPSNRAFYSKNYDDFSKKLDALYKKYSEKFKTVSNRNFVTGHAAFAYLCRDYGLKQNSVEDAFAEGEPSTKKLSDLVDYCKKNKVKTIFVEDMVSPRVSNTLAKEVHANVKKIYTLESKEDEKDYIQAMDSNLKRIYNSLK